jgi:hypothetical protein
LGWVFTNHYIFAVFLADGAKIIHVAARLLQQLILRGSAPRCRTSRGYRNWAPVVLLLAAVHGYKPWQTCSTKRVASELNSDWNASSTLIYL